jgi:hypothetical protein
MTFRSNHTISMVATSNKTNTSTTFKMTMRTTVKSTSTSIGSSAKVIRRPSRCERR